MGLGRLILRDIDMSKVWIRHRVRDVFKKLLMLSNGRREVRKWRKIYGVMGRV